MSLSFKVLAAVIALALVCAVVLIIALLMVALKTWGGAFIAAMAAGVLFSIFYSGVREALEQSKDAQP